MVVDLPAPLGPRKPVTRPGRDGEGQPVHGARGAVLLGEVVDVDAGHAPSLAAGGRLGLPRPVGSVSLARGRPVSVAAATMAAWSASCARCLRGTTYTPLAAPVGADAAASSLWMFIDPGQPWAPRRCPLVPLGLVPAVRLGEGVQAQAAADARRGGVRHLRRAGGHLAGPVAHACCGWSCGWLLGAAAMFATVWLPILTFDLAAVRLGHATAGRARLLDALAPHWAYGLLAPLPLLALYGVVVGSRRAGHGRSRAVAARPVGRPSGSPRWRSAPSSSWNAPGSRASCTTRSGTR